MPRPILDALKLKLAEYLKTLDMQQVIAFLFTLFAEKQPEGYMADGPASEIYELYGQLDDAEKQELALAA